MAKTIITILSNEKNTIDTTIQINDAISLQCFQNIKFITSINDTFDIGDLVLWTNEDETIDGIIHSYIAYKYETKENKLLQSKVAKYKLGKRGVSKNRFFDNNNGCSCEPMDTGECMRSCSTEGLQTGDCVTNPTNYKCQDLSPFSCICQGPPTPPPTPKPCPTPHPATCSRKHCHACNGPKEIDGQKCPGVDGCKCYDCGPDMHCTFVNPLEPKLPPLPCLAGVQPCTDNPSGCHCRCNDGKKWKGNACVAKSSMSEEEWNALEYNQCPPAS
jgi:hypothetical protein